MVRYSFVILLIARVVLLGWSASDLPGCAPAPPRGMWARIEDENALIVWQPETQTEHFIRRATFNSTANDFGFLVPTPSQPELGEVDSNSLFKLLGEITAPKYERRVIRVPKEQSLAPGAAPTGDAVRVVAEQTVAGMDAVVLQADNPDDLGKWLADHDYHFRPELRDWLEKYTSEKWYITAFKISAAMKESESKERALSSKAVRMTFQTDRPFYPYREPVDMRDERARNHDRFLRLFVLAQTQMEGGLGVERASWPGKTVWSNPLDAAQSKSLEELLKLPTALDSGAGKLWLTEIEDHSSPRPGTDEIFFAPATTPSALERPRIVYYENVPYDSRWQLLRADPVAFGKEYPGWVVLGVGAIVGAVIIGVSRRRRRTGDQEA
jgi:hypothetical protein